MGRWKDRRELPGEGNGTSNSIKVAINVGRDDEMNREETTTLFKGVARGTLAEWPTVAGAVCDTVL